MNGNSASETVYVWFSFGISFAVPFAAILIMNVLIITGIKRQRRQMSKLMSPASSQTSFTDVSTVSNGKVRKASLFTSLETTLFVAPLFADFGH